MFEQHPASSGFPGGDMQPLATAGPAAPARRIPPRINSGQLLAGAHEVLIEHAGQEYRLRLTRNDKLILTK